MNRFARRRLNLYLRDPHCHWCDCLTILPPADHVPQLMDHHATLDHLYERVNGRRDVSTPGGERTVLACNRCNQQRGAEHAARIKQMDCFVGSLALTR